MATPNRTGITRNWASASVGFDGSASTSASLILAGRPIVGMATPAASGWTAASLLFMVAPCPGGTFRYVRSDDSGSLIQMRCESQAAYAACTVLDKISPWYAVKLISGSVNGGVVQGIQQASARTFVFFFEG